MPRKKLIYTHEFPYHVCARSNNKEWFYLPTDEVWEIFVSEINRLFTGYKCSLHAFVLMSNHYHMLVTVDPNHNLGEVMRELQKSVSRRINQRAQRINHVFGGPYKAALIRSENDFLEVLKYVYRNPVKAGIVERVEFYKYSTLVNKDMRLSLQSNMFKIENPKKYLAWFNVENDSEKELRIKQALSRTEFRVSVRNY